MRRNCFIAADVQNYCIDKSVSKYELTWISRIMYIYIYIYIYISWYTTLCRQATMWLKGNACENVTKKECMWKCGQKRMHVKMWLRGNACETWLKGNACENVTKMECMWKYDWKGMHVKMWSKGNACENVSKRECMWKCDWEEMHVKHD